ncbi:MAG: hypothetical protein ACRDUA_14060, partial [Micromonosporaceae bacterium]
MTRRIVHSVLVLGIAALVTAASVLAANASVTTATDWETIGSDRARPYDEGQGLATIVRDSGAEIRYTGFATIPAEVYSRGWDHVGDPDSVAGWYVEPYQRADGGRKMFRAQAPGGAWTEYAHTLPSWEARENSFVAIAPAGPWMLAGEWGTMDRILGYPTPGLHPAASPGADLPYAFSVRLDRPVRDVQGCDFFSPTVLYCSSNDPAGELYGITKPLLRVDLQRPLDGSDVSGQVTAVRQLPLSSGCSGEFETEGIDLHAAGTMRV